MFSTSTTTTLESGSPLETELIIRGNTVPIKYSIIPQDVFIQAKIPLWAVDLVVERVPSLKEASVSEQTDASKSSQEDTQQRAPWEEFLLTALRRPGSSPTQTHIRFLFSSSTGTIVRSDLIPQRMESAPGILNTTSLLTPLQQIKSYPPPATIIHPSVVFPNAIAAIHISTTPTSFQQLTLDLQSRLSPLENFISATTIPPTRIAWVQGREDINCISRALNAASALGISLIILDAPGHWLQSPSSPWSHLREAFIPLDITPNAGLAGRIVGALREWDGGKVDGVVTISDIRLSHVARACEMLGLPTEGHEAFERAGDKGVTRMMEPHASTESVVFDPDSTDESILDYTQHLHYPLVVKPVIGWCSDCVAKVRSPAELQAAVRKASKRHAGAPLHSTRVVVEPYVHGPEVDANIVMMDGEVVFCDVSDDFPSTADSTYHPGSGISGGGKGGNGNFQETQNVMPSALPAREIEGMIQGLRVSLLRQGFRNGIFHCEARVRNSTVEFRRDEESGFFDLVPKVTANGGGQQAEKTEVNVYLHEINARPPGYLESVAVMLAYGVDYYALRLLLALGPAGKERFKKLAKPFANGPQFHLSVMIIQQKKAGIMRTEDAAREFLQRFPEAREWVVDYYTRKKGGDVLEGPDAEELWWIAFFSVVAREEEGGRKKVLERVEFVERNFVYEMDEVDGVGE